MRPGVFNIVFTALCALLSLASAAHAETETLEQAWGQAYQINPSLQAERASLRATDEQVSQALSHWRPSIDGTANVGKTWQYIPAQKPLGTADFADTSRSYGVQVTQPLFRGFRTEAETESAEKQVLAGRAKLNDAEQQLFLDKATAFLDLLRDEQVLDAERGNEDVLQKKLTETQVRYHAGELTQTDVHQAESRLARTHVSRFQAENSLTQDRDAYTRMVGKAPEHLQAPELAVDVSRPMDDVLHLAETRNPKVLSARYSIEAAKADVDLSKGSLLPEINLVGNSSRNWGQSSSLPGQEDSSQVLVQLTMPLYRSGADYSKTRAAEQTVTRRRMELEEARHKAHEAANNAWQALLSAKAALDADRDEIKASTLALEGVREESKVGTRTTLDVLNAEQELLDAKVDLARSQHDRDLAVLQIRAAVGELTADNLKLPVETYDPKRHYEDVRGQWAGFSADDARYRAAIPSTSE
jgi:TolC family type I secretion outer membrane protein